MYLPPAPSPLSVSSLKDTRTKFGLLRHRIFKLYEKGLHRPRNRGRCLSIQNRRITLVVALLIMMCMTFTILYAYNSSLERPFLPSLVSKRPQRSILILNLAVHITLFALAEFTSIVFEATRWALASRSSGTTALTFLTLSRATSFSGTVYLFAGMCGVRGRNSHQIWGLQRISLTLLRVALGIILLSDISFKATYHTVHEFPVVQSGQSPMNASIANDSWFNFTGPREFWWYLPSILADGKLSGSISPLHCSGEQCTSFFLPGPLSTIIFEPTLPNITESDYSTASAYIQENAPGYQVEFYPIDETRDPIFTLENCQVYGGSTLAINICLKKSDISLLAAWNTCPYDPTASNAACLNSTDWRLESPDSIRFSTKMTVSKRNASTVFNRSNFTIMDIINLSPPVSIIYEPSDFFGFYDGIFYVIDPNQTTEQPTTQFDLLISIASYLEFSADNQIETNGGARQLRLEEFLATPLTIYTNSWRGLETVDMGNTLALAVPGYKLVIAPVTLYLFMVGGLISVIWCFVALLLSMVIVTPSTSLFPEIDFASKVARIPAYTSSVYPRPRSRESLPDVLSRLSNANSYEIRKEFAPSRFYVQVATSDVEGDRPISTMDYDEDGSNRIFQG